jgi:serine/threonine protein kinase/tetratricopeptide (TPR) repeat protein
MSSASRTASSNGLLAGQTSRVIHILENYLAELERGRPPNSEQLIAQHPEFADVLRSYLDKLDVLHRAATGLRTPAEPVVPPGSSSSEDRGRLGDFRILREIGRGGMGVVYEAEQVSLDRRVALKVLPFAAALDGKQLLRFKNEAQAAAHLHHTHIVPVYAVGCERGVHYYAMQFIEGQTLAAMIAELRRLAGLPPARGAISHGSQAATDGQQTVAYLPLLRPAEELPLIVSKEKPAETVLEPRPAVLTRRTGKNTAFFETVARLGEQGAEALEHAHRQGVIHRDIKPANLLVDAPDHLWVTDFGLARCQQSEGGLTGTGDLVGTLRYMSPEQALAKPYLIDHRTDIYSLGVTLYELLTLEPAYGGRDRQEVLRQIAFEEPRPPRRLNPAIPIELETVVLKAMAKEPAARYGTAQELADDLRRFLDKKPIQARRPTLMERFRKWAQRHRPVVLTVLLLLVLAVPVQGVSTFLIWREKTHTQEAFAKATLQEAEAKSQSERAEANFRDLVTAAREVMALMQDGRWERLTQKQIRTQMADKLLTFFKRIREQGSDGPATRYERAWAHLLTANICRVHNRNAEATRNYEMAVDLFEMLVHESPENADYRKDLAHAHHALGLHLACTEGPKNSRAALQRAAHEYNQALGRKADPLVLNDYAWLLATSPVVDLRNPARAVALAEQATKATPKCGACWNTLGVARYRVIDLEGAHKALQQSMDLRDGGDSFDWLFLAMIWWRRGNKVKAHYWYTKAAEEIDQAGAYNEPICFFLDEATALLAEIVVQPKVSPNAAPTTTMSPKPPAPNMTEKKLGPTTL